MLLSVAIDVADTLNVLLPKTLANTSWTYIGTSQPHQVIGGSSWARVAADTSMWLNTAARIVTLEDIEHFAGFTGDTFYAHMDEVAAAANPFFPAMVTQMIEVGEESGQISSMLDKIADFYDREVDQAADALTASI